MTTGETLYLALVLATFGGFGIGLATASFRQSQADRRAAGARTRPLSDAQQWGGSLTQ